MLNTETLLLVAFSFFAGGFVKGVIGLGFPVVVLAVLAPVLGLKEAMAILVIPAIATNVWQAFTGGGFRELMQRLWPMLAMAIVGIALGVNVLVAVDTHILIGVLGIILFIYAVYSLFGPQLKVPEKHEFWMAPASGILGGFMFGVVGIYIVPGVLYVQALGLTRDRFIQALGITFLTIATTLGAVFWQHKLVAMETSGVSISAFLPLALGVYLGRKYRYSLSEELFRKLFFIALLISGIYMGVRGFL